MAKMNESFREHFVLQSKCIFVNDYNGLHL